jgi:DNA-binding CsgD family transcriptional regulator
LSRGLFRQFNIDNDQLLAQSRIRFDWIHPDDRARFVSDLEVSAATLGLLDHRVRVIGANGRVHWARGIARPSRRPDGSIVWDGIVIDVTREVEAEAALRVAKEEADRAHREAALLVARVVDRFADPIRDFVAFLASPAGRTIPVKARSPLQVVERKLVIALEELSGQAPETQSVSAAQHYKRPPRLTGRQAEVLKLIEAGQSNKAIAQRLGITPGTVKLHVAAVLRTLGVQTRRQLRAERKSQRKDSTAAG